MKKRKQLIIGIVVVILLVVIIITLCNKTELYIREDKINNKEIEHIALVYRNESWSAGYSDYVYIFDDDGAVYFEDFATNASKYQECENDLLKRILALYENKDKIEYRFEPISDSFKTQLYSTNYNWTIFEKGGIIIDGGEQTYYAILKIGEKYELIKLRQSGNLGELSWNGDYNDICRYMDQVRTHIREQNAKD